MGLLTNPVVLVDGAVANRTFSFRSQQPDKKAVVGDYIEDAAAIAAESKIVVKHDATGAVHRHLLQRTIKLVPAAATDGVRRRMTFNYTIMADPLFTAAEVNNEFVLTQDLLDEADVCAGLLAAKL
jgi:hypothetical protein